MMGRGRWENRKVTDGMEQADGQGGSGLAAVVVGSTFSSSRHKSSENSHTRGALAKTTGDEVRTIARFSTKVMGRNQKKGWRQACRRRKRGYWMVGMVGCASGNACRWAPGWWIRTTARCVKAQQTAAGGEVIITWRS